MGELESKEVLAENIKYYMDKYHKTRNEICETLNIKYSTFSDWVNAKKYPRIDKIELLASYFGISKSDLIEKHTNTPEIELDEDIRRIQRARKEMPEADRKKMMDILKIAMSEYFSNDYEDDDLDE